MNYLSVAEVTKKWNVSERSVRNYCSKGRIPGAFLAGKIWNIPETAEKPARLNAHKDKPETLLDFLKTEKQGRKKGGIYHKIQIELTYNSNHIEVGGLETAAPEEVSRKMKELVAEYNETKFRSFEEILDFHYRFETIHPFQDGNGRVGRLIMFKECLRNNVVPFIIEDDLKMFYYRGLANWKTERGYLTDTCLAAQDRFKLYLDYFHIAYVPE